MKQESFSDMEYSCWKKKTKREEFLEIMDEIIPLEEWVGLIRPYYPTGERGRTPVALEQMLRMYLLQVWFNLSDPGTEDAIYDSYMFNPWAASRYRLICPERKRLGFGASPCSTLIPTVAPSGSRNAEQIF